MIFVLVRQGAVIRRHHLYGKYLNFSFEWDLEISCHILVFQFYQLCVHWPNSYQSCIQNVGHVYYDSENKDTQSTW